VAGPAAAAGAKAAAGARAAGSRGATAGGARGGGGGSAGSRAGAGALDRLSDLQLLGAARGARRRDDDGPSNTLAKLLVALLGAVLGLVFLIIVPFLIVAQAANPCGFAGGGVGSVTGAPKQYVPLYLGAAQRYKLGTRGPSILAAIHKIESGFGTNMGPSSAGAEGHMQFIPSTWAAYGVDANGDGKKDPYDAPDAIYAAGRYLRASGAPGDWRRAIFAYNHAGWYVADVLETAAQLQGKPGQDAPLADLAGGAGCTATGPASLNHAITLYRPRSFTTLPARYMAYGSPQQVDTRIYPNVIWALERYGMRVTAARETGHATHGAGLAIDVVPARSGGISAWKNSTERFARDIGWRHGGCVRPTCPTIKPAFHAIFYNGYPAHGDPAHCSGSCRAHLHVSWEASTYAAAALTPPARWVKVFPSPGVGGKR